MTEKGTKRDIHEYRSKFHFYLPAFFRFSKTHMYNFLTAMFLKNKQKLDTPESQIYQKS